MLSIKDETLSRLGILSVAILIAIGTFWSYSRGGIDFAVFHHAWRLVLEGHGSQIYVNSPDRYLYAPGFAWIFAPVGLLPKALAQALWCLLKALVLGYLIRTFGKDASPGVCAWAVLVLSRPLLIDLQYGQINLIILGVSVWALAEHFQGSKIWKAGLSWFFLGIFAVAKIFPTPLLVIPWVRTTLSDGTAIDPERLRVERGVSIIGALLTVVLPVLTEGYHGALQLVFGWREALVEKGLPYESHNQSFTAALHHYFTTDPTHIISLGSQWVVIGRDLLSLEMISMLSMGWALVMTGFLLGWLLRGNISNPLRWISVAVAMLFVPSHLIWKPYFVFGIPAAMILATDRQMKKSLKFWILGIAFVLTNLTGFDMIGGYLSGRLEAASLFLWVHLMIVGFAVSRKEI